MSQIHPGLPGAAALPDDFDRALANRFRQRTSDLRETFLRYDQHRTGVLSAAELTHAIHRNWGFKISRQQVRALMISFNIRHGVDAGASFSYNDFVNFIDETIHANVGTEASRIGRFSNPAQAQLLVQQKYVGLIEPPPGVVKAELLAAMKRKLASRSASIATHELFLSFNNDRSADGVTFGEVRSWFRKQGLKLTDDNLREVVVGFDQSQTGALNYAEFEAFLQQFQGVGEVESAGWETADAQEVEAQEARREAAAEHRSRILALEAELEAEYEAKLMATVDEAMTDAQILRAVAEKMEDKKWKLVQAFRKFDTSNNGSVTAEEFREACLSLGVAVEQERLNQLVAKFDVTNSGALKYFEFVRMIGSADMDDDEPVVVTTTAAAVVLQAQNQTAPDPSPAFTYATAPAPVPAAAAAEIPPSGTGSGSLEMSSELEQLRQKLSSRAANFVVRGDEGEKDQAAVARTFTESDLSVLEDFRRVISAERLKMRTVFRDFDKDGTKSLSVEEFMNGLSSLGVKTDEDEAQRIVNRFDVNESGRIRYFEFVRMCHEATEI